MSETTEELSTQSGENPGVPNAEVEQGLSAENVQKSEQEDNLAELAPEKLAGMVRDKRKAEASVRSKLRDTEAERDKLAEAVTGFRRQAFAEAAKAARVQDSAVDDVLNAVDLEAVLAEDGTIDGAKVSEAVGALRKSHPHYFKPASSFSAEGGAPMPPDASWSDVLR